MIWWIAAYVIIAILVYIGITRNWTNKSTFEKIWISIFWIFLPPFYLIYSLSNGKKSK